MLPHVLIFTSRCSARRPAGAIEGTVRHPQVPPPGPAPIAVYRSLCPPAARLSRQARTRAPRKCLRTLNVFRALAHALLRSLTDFLPFPPNVRSCAMAPLTSTSLDLGAGRPSFGNSIVPLGWEVGAVPWAVRWGRVGEHHDAKRVLVSLVPRGPNGHISQRF